MDFLEKLRNRQQLSLQADFESNVLNSINWLRSLSVQRGLIRSITLGDVRLEL